MLPELKSEKTRTYFTFALAALAIVGGFVLVLLGKFEALETFASVVGVALGSDAATSIGYTVARTLKKTSEAKASSEVAKAIKAVEADPS